MEHERKLKYHMQFAVFPFLMIYSFLSCKLRFSLHIGNLFCQCLIRCGLFYEAWIFYKSLFLGLFFWDEIFIHLVFFIAFWLFFYTFSTFCNFSSWKRYCSSENENLIIHERIFFYSSIFWFVRWNFFS